MGILKSISDFILGKDADIFDDKGHVLHKLSKKKWDDWNNRIIKGSEYNWREHKGSQAGAPEISTETKSQQKN